MMNRLNIFSFSQVLSVMLLLSTLTVAGAKNHVYPDLDKQEFSNEKTPDTDLQAKLQFSATVQSSFNVNLGFDSFLLEEVSISQVRDLPRYTVSQFIPGISKSFKILLRRIISTNAP